MRNTITATLLLALCAPSFAQTNKGASVAPRANDDSVAAELASFEVADGYEVTLFASEELGIANPIAMRWGPRGRLWVLCTLAYPQIVPTAPPADKLFILEDTDHDGRADKSSVFADGLDMPTGFALGNGGVYLAEGDDLLFLTDTDGDDRADTRATLLSGFGTGDTHQNINSLTWSPGGELFFCQGLHNFSRVETPWGIVRMDEHGVWRLRPLRRQLHAFRGGSGQNPWGVAFGHWGEPFVKGNNTELSELLPVMVHTEHRHRPLDIGATRVKSMVCEIIDSPALPDDLQGNIIIAGYFAHIVDRLRMSADGSGHRGELLPPLFRTNHQSFRPVDLQTGPDGALYVADWYNPIIGHYQASLRHPDRDKKHGRIWRLTAKGRKTAVPVNLAELPTHILLDRLASSPLKERERIRITLSNRDGKTVLVDVAAWVRSSLDRDDPDYEHHLYEALCLYEWNETVNRPLLELLLAARNPLARAYATRVAGRWHDRLDDPLALLAKSIADPHPRVRLEAVVAAGSIPSSAAIAVAMRALDQPTDRFLDAALVQCAHALEDQWMAALRDGSLGIRDPRHLAFLLRQSSGTQAADAARALIKGPANEEAVSALTSVLAFEGTAADLAYLLRAWKERWQRKIPYLPVLADAAAIRDLRPGLENPAGILRDALLHGSEEDQAAAIQLAGLWKCHSLSRQIEALARGHNFPPTLRLAAIEALARIQPGDPGTGVLLEAFASTDPSAEARHAALMALAGLDAPRAAAIASAQLSKAAEDDEIEPLLLPFLARKDGDTVLATALAGTALSPRTREKMRAALGAAGRHSPALAAVLAPTPSRDAIGIPPYRGEFVRDLTAEVKSAGNAKRGSELYHRDALSCTLCHVLGVCGVEVGPELTAVGAGLPIELIIEAVVWPKRQIKEGYLSTTITTKDGNIVSGFLQGEDHQRIVIRDIATQADKVIAPGNVAARQDAGTIMPPGLTATLTRSELRDLVRFLAERKGQPAPPRQPDPSTP